MNSEKRGNRSGFLFFEFFLRLFGLAGAYSLLYLVCLYYLIFDRRSVAACKSYIDRRFSGLNIFRKILYIYRLFINQGKVLIDRYYIISGQGRFDADIKGIEELNKILNQGSKGFILLTAHVGNWQVAATALGKLNKPIYLLMKSEENAAVKEYLNLNAEAGKIKIISPEEFLSGTIQILKLISEGAIVSIMGDRCYGADSLEVEFLGEKAYFPYSAFNIAAAIGCPVVVMLSAKLSGKKYSVNVKNIIAPQYSSKSAKRAELASYVQQFAHILEDYVKIYPFQWFVFQDIWVNNGKNE